MRLTLHGITEEEREGGREGERGSERKETE